MKPALLLAAVLALAACKTEEDARAPAPMPEDAIAYDCQMYMVDHPGPKAQVLLSGYDEPFWFSQVSAAMAFLNGPEKLAPVEAVFVSDMASARSWSEPGAENWIAADAARYVIGSDQMGGMGTPEAISFATPEAAGAYQAEHGGRVVGFGEVPAEYLQATLDNFTPGTEVGAHTHGTDGGADADGDHADAD